jgi:hypothetical protein
MGYDSLSVFKGDQNGSDPNGADIHPAMGSRLLETIQGGHDERVDRSRGYHRVTADAVRRGDAPG